MNRNPKHRLGATHDAKELREHPFFADIDWAELQRKNVVPPFKPKLSSETDTSNFDPEFTNAPMTGSLNARAAALASQHPASTPLSPGMQEKFRGFTFVDESSIDDHFLDRPLAESDDEYDRMEEDVLEDEWADRRGFQDHHASGGRMSGVMRDDEGGVFNGGMEI